MALAGNNGYGNFGYGNIDRGGGGGGGSFLNGINFLSGDFDVGIDGDLLLGALYLTPKVLCFTDKKYFRRILLVSKIFPRFPALGVQNCLKLAI